MDPDSFQQAWQSQPRTRVTVDADLLLQEVQRNQRAFLATVSRQDFSEVAVALVLLPVWVYLGNVFSLPWTWYLGVPAIAWIAGFILYYRLRYPMRVSDLDEPLVECVKDSLRQVDQRIWLQRNVLWWYLLPPGISLLVFFRHVALLRSEDGLAALGRADVFIVLIAVYLFVYFRNQYTVKSELEPRRAELMTLLMSLSDEESHDVATTNRVQKAECSAGPLNWLIVSALCVIALVALPLLGGFVDVDDDQIATSSGQKGNALASLVSDLRKENKLVGLAALVTVDGQVEAAAVEGERKSGSGVPATIEDRWHVGGISKAITATMIARLVEAGQMDWSDTVGEIFHEASVHEDWRAVTLKQLLTDTAGAPKNFAIGVRRQRPALGTECTQARLEAVLGILADKPLSPPGEKFAYSNVGYVIAGAMAEKVTGTPWEDLVKREIFEPLKLTESGFGPPKSSDAKLEQPRGHHTVQGWKISVDDETDNTPIMGPSATVHMSLGDLTTFAREHMLGELGEGTLLSTETYKLLHSPERDGYACGWLKKEPGARIPSTVYWHNGSNTMWYSLVVFVPEKKMVVAVASNDGDFESAEAAALEILIASVNEFKLAKEPVRRTSQSRENFPKRSPYAAIRWLESLPEVKVDDEWFKLVSLDDVPTTEILAFSQQEHGEKWRKRFEEDLVELLSRMGHPPGDAVKLTVQSLSSSETQVLEGVPMTDANRRAIYAAARARENTED
jgi:CubicO group peptidase (beta-lactamase class C family)